MPVTGDTGGTRETGEPSRAGAERAALVAAVLALHLPFLGQGLVIDDGNFVDQALQILREPTAPYAFDIRLTAVRGFYGYFANPPGLAYWLAAAIGLAGRSEAVLHAAMLPFTALAIVAAHGLARAWRGRGLLGGALVLAAPAFLVSGHTVMADVPAAALSWTAVWAFSEGLEHRRRSAMLAAGLAAGAACLLKYSALGLFPLLALYAVVRGRWARGAAGALVLAVVPFAAWCVASRVARGEVHLLAAASLESIERSGAERLVQAVAAVAGLGGTMLVPPLLAVAAAGAAFALGRRSGTVVSLVAAAGFVAGLPHYPAPLLDYAIGNRLLGALMFAGGLAAVAWSALAGLATLRGLAAPAGDRDRRDAARREAARTALCVAWVLGLLLLDVRIAFATPKYLVPAVLPLVLLLLGHRHPGGDATGQSTAWLRRPAVGWPFAACTAGLALALCVVGAAQGSVHRAIVTEHVPGVAAGRTVWFVNHWTLRHYAEHAGHRWLGPGSPSPGRGDVVYVVTDAHHHGVPDALADRLRPVARRSWPAPLPLQSINPRVLAGYWAHLFGAMPWVVTTEPLATVVVFEVR